MDLFGHFFAYDEEDWWDSYYDYQDEKDAYWINHYSHVHCSLPDSCYIQKLQLYRTASNVLSKDEQISYKKLYDIIMKIDHLFSLWQKRLSHEWNKDVKKPVVKQKENQNEAKTSNEADKNDDQSINQKKSSDNKDASVPICPELQQAVNIIEHEHRMNNHLQQLFSDFEDDDDDFDDFDDEGSFGYMDSDDWESSMDEELNSDEDFYEHELRRYVHYGKHKKEAKRREAVKQYFSSAEKYYSAFPTSKDAENALQGIVLLKSWIVGILMSKLTKYLGQWLPDLVLEKILSCLQSSYTGELSMNTGFIAKTDKFIEVEKTRMRELFAKLLDIYSLLFEIMFKNHCTSNTIYLKDYFIKVFEIAFRKMKTLDDLHTWLLSSQDEDITDKKKYDFMSGICYKNVIKESARNIEYFLHLNESYSCMDGDRLAILIPCRSKEAFVRIYDVLTGKCMHTHRIDSSDMQLGMAINGNYLALVLEKDSISTLVIYDIQKDQKELLSYKIVENDSDSAGTMFFVEIDGEFSIAYQHGNAILVFDLGVDFRSPKLSKEYKNMKLLAMKGRIMITKDIENHDHNHHICTAKEVAKISKKIVGVKIFDLKEKSLLQVIEHPKVEKDRPQYYGSPKWSVVVDNHADSKRFLLWSDEIVQLWDLSDGVHKVQDINLGRRVSSGIKLALNKNIIMIQNTQKSHDCNYDTIELLELLFYDIDSSKICYFETFHNRYDDPDSNVAVPGGPFFARHFTDDNLILLHNSSVAGEIWVFRFNLDAKAIISLQATELILKKQEEERQRILKEAERKKQDEERRKRREVQRQKRLQKKIEQNNEKRKKQLKIEEIRRLERNGAFVEGVVTDWRGTYGFMQVPNIGSVFIHRSDILSRSFVNNGSRIQCRIQEQSDHPRPKAIFAMVV